MVSEQDYPRQQMVWSDWVGWYIPRRNPNPFRSLAADQSVLGAGSRFQICGKIPKPGFDLGKMMKSVVRYEADASDPTAVWRVVHLRPPEEPRGLPDRVPPAELKNEKTRRTEDLRQINLNSTQGVQLKSTPEGNFNVSSTGFSVVATGWGRDPLPNPPLAFPTLNPSHGPELEKQCPQLNVTGVVWDDDSVNCEDDNMSLDNESDQDDDFSDTEVQPSEADRVKDLAVLKVDAPTDLLKPINVGLSSALRVGQQCLAIGSPFGFDHALTVVVISGLNQDIFSKARVTIEVGAEIVRRVLSYPLKLIAKNADVNGSVVTEKIHSSTVEKVVLIWDPGTGSKNMKMRHEVEEERNMLQMSKVWQQRLFKEPEEKQLSVSGHYWGRIEISGNMLSFNVVTKEALSSRCITYSDVA